MTTLAFYRQQAARQQAAADCAMLANVRALSQTAANAWTALADRLQRHETAKTVRENKDKWQLEEASENPDSEAVPARAMAPALSDNQPFR